MNFRITARGYIDGIFLVDGVRQFKGLGPAKDLLHAPSGSRRTPKQFNDAIQRLWEDKRADIEAKAGLDKYGDHQMGDVLREWHRLTEGTRSPRTLAAYRLFGKQYLEAVGEHGLKDFSLYHVDRFIAWLQGRQLETATINIRLRTLNTFLNWALERELTPKKPRIRQLRTTRKLPKVLTDAEMAQLFARIRERRDSHPNRRLRWFYRLHERFLMVARYTGARLSEVFWLRWEQIDLGQGMIRIEKQQRFDVKERREKELPVPEVLAEYLAAERAQHPDEVFLLDNRRGKIAYQSPFVFSRAFHRHLSELGLAGRGIKPVHGLRAYFAGELRNKLGLDLHTVKTWLGHSTVSVTEGYFPDPNGVLREGLRRYNSTMRERR